MNEKKFCLTVSVCYQNGPDSFATAKQSKIVDENFTLKHIMEFGERYGVKEFSSIEISEVVE